MKVIVSGSRYGVYPEFFKKTMDSLFIVEDCPYTITELVNGGARGVDSMSTEWAFSYGIKVVHFFPDWSLGDIAGPIRNKQMAEYGDILIAFFNSNADNLGTKNMCSVMNRHKKKIIRFHEKLCQAEKSLV